MSAQCAARCTALVHDIIHGVPVRGKILTNLSRNTRALLWRLVEGLPNLAAHPHTDDRNHSRKPSAPRAWLRVKRCVKRYDPDGSRGHKIPCAWNVVGWVSSTTTRRGTTRTLGSRSSACVGRVTCAAAWPEAKPVPLTTHENAPLCVAWFLHMTCRQDSRAGQDACQGLGQGPCQDNAADCLKVPGTYEM